MIHTEVNTVEAEPEPAELIELRTALATAQAKQHTYVMVQLTSMIRDMERAHTAKVQQSLAQKMKDNAAATNSVSAQINRHQQELETHSQSLETLTGNLSGAKEQYNTDVQAAEETCKQAKLDAKTRYEQATRTVRSERKRTNDGMASVRSTIQKLSALYVEADQKLITHQLRKRRHQEEWRPPRRRSI